MKQENIMISSEENVRIFETIYLPMWLQMPYKEYCTEAELAAYGAIFNSRSPVGNSTMFVSLLQRVSEKRFKSVDYEKKGIFL